MYDILHLPQVIEIGKTGENDFRPFEFDLRPWLAELPDGVATIVHIRPGETAADSYIAATTFEDGILTWRPGLADLGEVEGYGQIEIWLEEISAGTRRGKSEKVQTYVKGSIGPGEADPPEPQESWLEQMTGLKTETVTAKNAAVAAQAEAEAIAAALPGTIATALEEAKESGEFDGPPGPQGERGPAGPKGDPGDPADPTVLIDDTTTTATNKVWSAKKTAEEVSDLNSQIDAKVSKDSLDNAGITARTYTTKFGGQFSVTTATTTGYISPYARASVTGRINKQYMHRVTFDGTEYILPTRLWFDTTGGGFKVYEYLGNLGLYISDVSGVPSGTDNVPFVIISDLNGSSSIDVLTQTGGTYTIKVEQISNTQTALPKSLIWDNNYVPIEKNENNGTYNGFSIGVNELKNTRGTFAIGYCNKITNEFSYVLGDENTVAGGAVVGSSNESAQGCALGWVNKVRNLGTAIGHGNVANDESVAVGSGLTAKHGVTAIGLNNVEPEGFPVWAADTAYTAGQLVSAISLPTPFMCLQDHTSTSSFVTDFQNGKWEIVATSLKTDTVLLVGNGTLTSKSNALKIGVNGDARFNGNVYVGCNADSTGGIRLATVDELNPVQTVGGSTPSITAVAGTRYVCGECATLSITPPASGCIDVVFTSGSTPTVLTVPNTVKFPAWFDADDLEANKTYEINILDGVYGVVTSWA